MTRIVIIGLLIAAALGGYRWLRAKKPSLGKAELARMAVLVLLVICVVLAATGRAHWLTVFAAGALALLQRILPLAVRFLPLAQHYYKKNKGQASSQSQQQSQQQQYSARATSQMTVQQALDVLGLKPGASKEEVVQAHRKLIQKLHPDRGGSDHLAAEVNEAKRVLLKR